MTEMCCVVQNFPAFKIVVVALGEKKDIQYDEWFVNIWIWTQYSTVVAFLCINKHGSSCDMDICLIVKQKQFLHSCLVTFDMG